MNEQKITISAETKHDKTKKLKLKELKVGTLFFWAPGFGDTDANALMIKTGTGWLYLTYAREIACSRYNTDHVIPCVSVEITVQRGKE